MEKLPICWQFHGRASVRGAIGAKLQSASVPSSWTSMANTPVRAGSSYARARRRPVLIADMARDAEGPDPILVGTAVAVRCPDHEIGLDGERQERLVRVAVHAPGGAAASAGRTGRCAPSARLARAAGGRVLDPTGVILPRLVTGRPDFPVGPRWLRP